MMSWSPRELERRRPNFGLEQTARRLRQGVRHLVEEPSLRQQCSRAAAQAACWADLELELERVCDSKESL
jgi:hypothetical protein